MVHNPQQCDDNNEDDISSLSRSRRDASSVIAGTFSRLYCSDASTDCSPSVSSHVIALPPLLPLQRALPSSGLTQWASSSPILSPGTSWSLPSSWPLLQQHEQDQWPSAIGGTVLRPEPDNTLCSKGLDPPPPHPDGVVQRMLPFLTMPAAGVEYPCQPLHCY